ncbi:HNH endonuclease [bacterium]|nr:HNH endonuclease [bacterium]
MENNKSILDIFKKKEEKLKQLKGDLLKRRYTRMDKEIWREIKNALFYEVSNWGNIRSWKKRGRTQSKRETPVILNQSAKKTGEMVVNIQFAGKFKSIQVKRLVYDTFHDGYRHPNTIIAHRDGDKSNNRFDNLILAREYIDLPDYILTTIRYEFSKGTTKKFLCDKYKISLDDLDDIIHGDKGRWAGGIIVERQYKRELTPEEVEEIRSRAMSGEETEAEIGKVYGIREQRISRILNESRRHFKL